MIFINHELKREGQQWSARSFYKLRVGFTDKTLAYSLLLSGNLSSKE